LLGTTILGNIHLDTSRHRGGVPSMRIRDGPSARSVQRAAEKLLGTLGWATGW